MTNILIITKILLKNNVFSFSSKKKGKSSSGGKSGLLFLFLIAFSVACIGGPVIFLLKDLLKVYDLSELILSFIIPIGGITSIIFGIFSIISVFYFSKDSEQFLHMPIKSGELLIAKFLASLVSEYVILVMFIFPIIFGVGIGCEASLLYYLYSIIICILIPIIPSSIMAILIMLSNKIFNFSKRKDLFVYVMSGLLMVFSFAYSFGLTYFLEGSDNGFIYNLFYNSDEYINISKRLFPLFNSATTSLVHYDDFIGFAAFMTFIGFNILSLVVVYFVGSKLYINGLTKNNGNGNNKKKSLEDIYKKNNNSIILELMKKEWLTIKRSPIFMLNIVISNLIFPFILLLSSFIGFNTSSNELDITSLINFNNSGIYLIVIGILVFVSSLCSASSSAISREGSSARMMKIIPVELKKQLDAKVYFSMIIDGIVLLVFEAFCFIVLNTPWYYVLIINVPLFLILFISNYCMLILDLLRPKLEWKEESEAVKQNINVFFGMIISMLVSIGIIALGIILINVNINIFLMFTIISVILLLLFIVLNYLVKKYQNKLFNKVG